MKLTLTGRVGSIISDYNDDDNSWYGSYEVTVWYDSVRYKTTVDFEEIGSLNDIPVQGDGVAIEFDVETKEITIL